MASKATLKWLEKENSIFAQSILALFGALFASNLTTFSILGQPCNWRISIGLFIFCILFRIKNHLAEARLQEFYSNFTRSLTNRGQSLEQITDEFYLHLSHLLCLSIIHFYIFFITFSIYLIFDQCFNYAYIKYQINKKLKWGENKFNPIRLFKSWLYMSYAEVILILILIYLIPSLNINFNLVASIFIVLIIIIEIVLDWFFINRGFYLDYFVEEHNKNIT